MPIQKVVQLIYIGINDGGSENTFRITLPNMIFRSEDTAEESIISKDASDLKNHKVTAQMQRVLDYLSQYEAITDDELMELLNLKRTRTYIVSAQMAKWV